ncbi:MAG: branched-chain amino acid ABC transporter substrate-binding protein [Pseudomonadota bacterium]|nr:MAG: branched-chain amino acid ABC transporter substrate-binding protein [Pseudomonadota bacterium]
MTENEKKATPVQEEQKTELSRRSLFGATAAVAGAGVLWAPQLTDPIARTAYAAGSDAPIRIGFQVHRTGIGATYGKWYERTTNAAAKYINDLGAWEDVRWKSSQKTTAPTQSVVQDVVEKFATQHKVDFVYGTLFSHVVMGSSPRAGELKIPYFVVSEGHHVASGKLNRYVFQPCITEVPSQIYAVSKWMFSNLGKKVAVIYPDYAFGYDHRDYSMEAAKKNGGTIAAQIPIPPTETSFTRYFTKIPRDTDVIYHVMVGPGVLTFVREMGEHFGSRRPEIFGFIDSLEGVDINSPGLDFLDGTYFWEAMPRYADGYPTAAEKVYRDAVGVNASGASKSDSKDVSTYSHMFGCWETMFAIREAVEQSGYRDKRDYPALIETMEGFTGFNEGIPSSPGSQSLQRKKSPVLWKSVHFQGCRREVERRPPYLHRRWNVRFGCGLHQNEPLIQTTTPGTIFPGVSKRFFFFSLSVCLD